MKIILYPLAFIVGAYCLVLALLYINQYKLLYFPAPKISSIKLPELSFRSGDLTLSGYLLDLSQSSGVKDVPAIIYYGGNAEAIEENAPFFAEFLKGFKSKSQISKIKRQRTNYYSFLHKDTNF